MPDNTRKDAAKPGSSGEQQQHSKDATKPGSSGEQHQLGNDAEQKEYADAQQLWDLFGNFQQQLRVTLPSVNGQPPTPLSQASLQRVVKTSEDMALAHEIAVNADFKLKPPSEEESTNTLHSVVRRTMHAAYWNLVQDDLTSDPPRFDTAMKILAEVKKSFAVLLRGNNDRALARLNEWLNEETIQEQIQFGTFDIRIITNYVIDLMGMACAANRDEEVAALKNQTDTVAILRGILETLDHMKLDMANYIVHVTRQQVERSSVAYEREKFNELKQVCGDNFPLTLEWLQRHFTLQADAPAGHANNEPVATAQDAASIDFAMKKIPLPMAKAYVALLDSTTPHTIPELLKLDQDRLHQMRVEALRLSICATVLQLTVSMIPALVNQPDKRQELSDKLIVLFNDCNSKQSVLQQLDGMWAFVLKHVDGQQPLDTPLATALKNQIEQIATGDSAVHRIIWNRLQTLLVEALAVIGGDYVAVPGCYQHFSSQLLALSANLVRIAKHNYAVYGDYYAYLINRQSTA
uniref:Putative sok1 kinase belonging to the ste20/sps1/gc kinase family n=1 Tax=Anopheles braziliensis TaxID=58242 RepID=A0A2M3Z0W5_9DIPT